jgi:transposase
MERSTIGIDTAKQVFQLHIGGGLQQPVKRERLSRGQFLGYCAKLAPALIGMEACGSSHYWARELSKLGHDVKLIPAEYVKGFVIGPMKTDARDARGCYLAVQQPDIKFVPIKSEEQQAGRALHRAQELLVQQRTQTSNNLRGLCAEFGLTCPLGFSALNAQLEGIVSGVTKVPELLRGTVIVLFDLLCIIHAKERELMARIVAQARHNPLAGRLMKVPGIGPVIAHALTVGVVDPAAFSSSRRFAAWLGLTPGLHASGNKSRLGHITKRGDETIRRLLVLGACSCVKQAKAKPGKADPWLVALLVRRPFKVAMVAKAAKTARIVWAMMTRGEEYRPDTSRAAPSTSPVAA